MWRDVLQGTHLYKEVALCYYFFEPFQQDEWKEGFGMGFVVITGGFTLDDTVLTTNEVMRKAPGGNILYGALAARIWHDHVGMFGVVGDDYPESYLEELRQNGLDLSGITRVEGPCLKNWALLEGGNSRQLIYKLDSGSNEQMDPRSELAEDSWVEKVSAVHINAIPIPSQRKLIEKFSGSGRFITMDTIHIKNRIDPTALKNPENLQGVDMFLPSLEEVRDIYGDGDLKKIMRDVCHKAGCGMAVKMGNQGSLVYDNKKDQFIQIPICPVEAKDTTGAGDSFCGGFLAGYDLTGDLVQAAVMGTVSSSFAIQEFGAIHMLKAPRDEAKKRFDQVYKNVNTNY